MNGNHLNDFNFELAGTIGGFGGGINDKKLTLIFLTMLPRQKSIR